MAQAIARARPEAEKALQLENRLAAAYATIGHIHELSYEWTEAELEFRLAIGLDPSYATAHQWYSDLLSLLGRHAEAEEQAKLAIQSDPLAPIIENQLGVAFYYARRYEDAKTQPSNRSSIRCAPIPGTRRLLFRYTFFSAGTLARAQSRLASARTNGNAHRVRRYALRHIQGRDRLRDAERTSPLPQSSDALAGKWMHQTRCTCWVG